jgi:HPt (histidine-containing phosphotransfer) domain-containing protein
VQPDELDEVLEAAADSALVAPRAASPVTRPLAAFDPAAALASVSDDRELLAQMVQIFRAESPALLSALRESIEAKDPAALMQAAHTLTGSVASFGPSESLGSTRALERMGRERTFVGAIALVAVLEQQLGRLERDLALVAQDGEVLA